uniref:phenylalanine--tRNA ligase n=1 Tax=Rodentolepis nana TaxID=102285 RepID=A0A0R3TDJ3_RODNA
LCSTSVISRESSKKVCIRSVEYETDKWYNLSPKTLDLISRNLHNQEHHPLWLIKQRIVDFFYRVRLSTSCNRVVSTFQNFDSLLVRSDHVSRRPTDTYYINQNTCLRSHTSAHEMELIKSGLNAFITVGDVYRRDDIDALHYPVFHQLEGVRLFSKEELFQDVPGMSNASDLFNFEAPAVLPPLSEAPPSSDLPDGRQPRHSPETARLLEIQLKSVLEDLALNLFGKDTPIRWVPAYFPFTNPSFELEVHTGMVTGNDTDGWTEMLGCGILRQEILDHCGASDKVAYAFGLGLERWAMKLYGIPDIRLFWSKDEGFLHQFKVDDINKPITFKAVSNYPPCPMDISFWLPDMSASDSHLEFERDFYEIVREAAGDLVEQVSGWLIFYLQNKLQGTFRST